MRALVIEDDPHLRGKVTQAMFAGEGFAVGAEFVSASASNSIL